MNSQLRESPNKKYAYHEASHAVVWMLGGFKIKSVTLKESIERTDAIVKTNRGCTNFGEYVGPGAIGSDSHINAYLSGILAGGIGEEKYTGFKSDGLHADCKLVQECIKDVNPVKAAKRLVEITIQAEALLKEQAVWNAVTELASLLQERYAYGGDVYKVILKNCPTKLLTASVSQNATES